MNEQPDFDCRCGTRVESLVAAGCSLVVLAGFVTVAVFVDFPGRPVWGAGLAVATAIWLGWLACGATPRVLRGRVYRVTVAGGRVRVDSPYPDLGPGFDIPLAGVARLVTWREDGDDEYAVVTADGERLRVHRDCGPGLFEALRRLRPDLAEK
jgi:hypothetical protein